MRALSMVESGGKAKYWAFISYSHKDAGFGQHLHRRLEHYALPRRLCGRTTALGMVPKRLVPIFRDVDELPAANDLSAEVRAALQESRSLIVVCSPAAAASQWVAREIAQFRRLYPDRPILAALIAGEPATAFPQALWGRDATGAAVEPLAADFRAVGDGERLGLLKLIAGVTGLGLGELVQRDSVRRLRRAMAITAAAAAVALAMIVLTLFAVTARLEAERQRTAAEGLVEFMLTDLRTTLKGVGRLDAMTAVNRRAWQYYASQDLEQLPPESLERRARILHAMGEDEETQGHHAAAFEKFLEARRTTAALLAAAPKNPERMFNHAQSEFWIGYAAYAQQNYPRAKAAFQNYRGLTGRLVAAAPNNPKYLRENGYAEGNICSVLLMPPRDVTGALRACTLALRQMEAAARHEKPSVELSLDIANRHAWLADVYLFDNAFPQALKHRMTEVEILYDAMQNDPKNMDLKNFWITAQMALARMETDAGKDSSALDRLNASLVTSNQLIAFDPSNQTWIKQHADLLSSIARTSKSLSERKEP